MGTTKTPPKNNWGLKHKTRKKGLKKKAPFLRLKNAFKAQLKYGNKK